MFTYHILGDNLNFLSINNKEFIVKVNYSHKLNNKRLEDMLKEILFLINKKYGINIYGFYEIDVYDIPNFVKIFKYYKKDEDDYFRNIIDIKINKHKNDCLLEFNDYLLIENYKEKINHNTISSQKIKEEDIYKLCEHYNIKYLNLQQIKDML